jgi:hypothetical protein
VIAQNDVCYRALPGRERGQDVGRAKAASRPNIRHSKAGSATPKPAIPSST